jgi:cobalt-zinc-cadmium efflux system outer membrane protein
MKARFILICILTTLPFSLIFAQDSIRVSLNEAERMFLLENAQLIAQRYQIEWAKAEIITAKLFDNPELSYENLFFNHETRNFLETSRATGQYSASITQLIKLAGKRNKDIRLAETGVKLEAYAYFDLMRTLRYELRSTYFEAYYSQLSAAVYDQLIFSLTQLLSASEQQLKLGNIASKDVIRIKSRLYALKAEYITKQNDLETLKSRLKLLTNILPEKEIVFSADGIDPESFRPDEKPFSLLLDSARVNRADLQLAKTGLTYAQNMLAVQKARAIPDLSISLSYDLKGNYPEQYTGLGVSFPIPLFNRNQGEIKKAKIAIDASNDVIRKQEHEIEIEIATSYKAALNAEKLYKSIDRNFNSSFEQLMTGVIKSYKDRNISLLEFLDFYDAYKENTNQLNDIQNQLMSAKEAINYYTGITIYK